MASTVNVAQVGICGYGLQYLAQFLDKPRDRDVRLAAAVARRPERCARLPELERLGVRVFPTPEALFAAMTPDLVIINSPIQLHLPHTRLALAAGANVLCEKPAAATVQDATALAAAADAARGFTAIGYQWSFTDAIQGLKRDILAGAFGRPLRFKSLVLWPRNREYYARNDWAGALALPDGTWVLDSVLGNATAHFLHNSFYLLGDRRETAARPLDIRAELYRANAIQNYDTVAVRCRMPGGAEVLHYASHAVPANLGPLVCAEFEAATVAYEDGPEKSFVARFRDGRIRRYGGPEPQYWEKIWRCAEAVRTGEPVACNAHTALPLTLAVNGAQESMPEIAAFPPAMLQVRELQGAELVVVQGLDQALVNCYAQAVLPSEHGGLDWSRPARAVDLGRYAWFPGGVAPAAAAP